MSRGKTGFGVSTVVFISLAVALAACSSDDSADSDSVGATTEDFRHGRGSKGDAGSTTPPPPSSTTPPPPPSSTTPPPPSSTTPPPPPPPVPTGLGFDDGAPLAPPAAILNVGPGATYATPCAAVAAAKANDEIDIAPGTYTDSCSIGVAGLRLKGVGGRPKIDLSGTDHPANYKGIYVIDASDVVIENLELTGAHISDANGANAAGIRVEADGLRVIGCYIHDNQDGILGAPATTAGKIRIESSEFENNGLGPGCTLGGCTHNLYLNHFDTVVFQFNWTHHMINNGDTGHLFKSRAVNNYLLYNRITDETGHSSYEVDLPNGGLAVLVGNMIEKGTNPGNSVMVSWGEEGATNAGSQVYLASNTLVNDSSKGTFVNVTNGGTLTAHDNIFAGPGTPASTGSLSADNLSGVDPSFTNRAAYDYHLLAGSPAIGKAVNAGAAGTFSLTPNAEYVQPTSAVARASANDIGAFEHH